MFVGKELEISQKKDGDEKVNRITNVSICKAVGLLLLVWSYQPWYRVSEGTMVDIFRGSHSFSPMTRFDIPKRDGSKRPVTKPSEGDRLVLKALARILSYTLDSSFSNASHGFRPKRSPTTLIQEVKALGQPVDSIIIADIVKCFDTLVHSTLLSKTRELVGPGNEAFMSEGGSFQPP